MLEVTGEVGRLRAGAQAYGYYTAGDSGTGRHFPENTPGLLVDALTEYCKTDNLKRFDTDGDGFVDGIFLIHAGGGAEAEPEREQAQGHDLVAQVDPAARIRQTGRQGLTPIPPSPKTAGWASSRTSSATCSACPTCTTPPIGRRASGNWCLMAGGSWGGDGNKPTRMSCWCLAKLGWIKPVNAKSAQVRARYTGG